MRRGVGEVPTAEPEAQAVAEALFELARDDGGPSVSTYVARHATLEQARELLVHKSPYQLKEADPHTWAIPRLTGRAKSALVEIQTDEYGGGRAGRMHSELFASTMEGLGLDSSFGAYIDLVPAVSLASVNAMSLFGLHRRFRGAIVGHLAMYEMTSSIPQARYARGFRRLGFESPVTEYFDEHVEADAVHEQIAARDLAGGLVEQEPHMAADVFFGAAAVGFWTDWSAVGSSRPGTNKKPPYSRRSRWRRDTVGKHGDRRVSARSPAGAWRFSHLRRPWGPRPAKQGNRGPVPMRGLGDQAVLRRDAQTHRVRGNLDPAACRVRHIEGQWSGWPVAAEPPRRRRIR